MPLAMSSTGLTLLLSFYVLLCIAVMYFCMLANPSVSRAAYAFQITLPVKFWNVISKFVGKEKLHYFQEFMDRALVLMYFIVVGGSWSVVFWHIYPWLLFETDERVSNIHGLMGVAVFLACFISWGVANKSHPGKVTAKNFQKFDHYPYDNLLFPPYKRCETTKLPKLPRSKFDRIKYHSVIPRYDHFCGWTYNTYGEENYRWFLLFLLQHVIMCFYGSYVCFLLFQDHISQKKLMELTFFDRATGETVKADKWIVFQYMFARRTLECCVFCIMFVMGIALAAFLGYHVYLTTVGQTTNENSKWGDINDWHKRQLAKYKRAIKEGKIKVSPSTKEDKASIESPELDDDADVTCTPGSNSTTKQNQNQHEHPDYFDPGPMPKNVYDRGWKENWREVLFPMSKRTNALALGGYTKRLPPPPQTQTSKTTAAKSQLNPPQNNPKGQSTGKPKAT